MAEIDKYWKKLNNIIGRSATCLGCKGGYIGLPINYNTKIKHFLHISV